MKDETNRQGGMLDALTEDHSLHPFTKVSVVWLAFWLLFLLFGAPFLTAMALRWIRRRRQHTE